MKPSSSSSNPTVGPSSSSSSTKAKVLSLRIGAPKPVATPSPLAKPEPAPIPSYLIPTTVTRKKREKIKPFRFLDLPTELRLLIYHYFFFDAPKTIDLDPENYRRIHKRLALLKTCRTIRHEAADFFYSTKTFRVFPCHPGRYFKTKKPLLARMKPGPRSCLTSLEVRLGPGWSQPPKGWVVNDALGLKECVKVWKVRVFVECDPGESVFKGFRQENGFFEKFASRLLGGVLKELPNVRVVEYDGWESVKVEGGLVQCLIATARNMGMEIMFGPDRGWTETPPKVQKMSGLYEGDTETPPCLDNQLAGLESHKR